ncbi:hypothetical protein PIB30_098425 [Stylosanthes scabra]|uniref:Uncharacterized protein n=1 Tax=Stylosanthes scabra TaxID=79078 RepID=A0ABU6UW81_9FABA|nr:hypothetical protein [Stylosanthes scabra]
MEKQSRFDRLMQKMVEVEVEGTGPRSVLPHPRVSTSASGDLASTPAALVPPAPSSGAVKTRKKPSVASSGKPFSVEREEGAKEDPSANIRQKRRKRKAFPADYNFRAALDAGLTQGPIREILGPLVPEQLLVTAQYLVYKLTACLQVGVENAFAAKVKLEKELVATKDQVDVLTAERDSALAAPLLKAKIDSLTKELRVAEGKHLSALARMKEGKQIALDEAEAVAGHWRDEWKSLAEKTVEMVWETFDILMDQVCHVNLAMDYSMITLDTGWDPKGKRIYNPKALAEEKTEPTAENQSVLAAEGELEVLVEPPELQVEKVVPEEGGGCPT